MRVEMEALQVLAEVLADLVESGGRAQLVVLAAQGWAELEDLVELVDLVELGELGEWAEGRPRRGGIHNGPLACGSRFRTRAVKCSMVFP